ncbi:MAG: ribosomal-processing cysteine protease Prp [Clostridia bacterium]|nr:ribosomal-processing cysteine protease Prp [Clostridia bacterium]
MINIRFLRQGEELAGFVVSGHSGFAETGSDIVCAAVSSAAYMTANTITDILMLKPSLTERDGCLSLQLSAEEINRAGDILKGFELHMKELEEQYPDYIKLERGA